MQCLHFHIVDLILHATNKPKLNISCFCFNHLYFDLIKGLDFSCKENSVHSEQDQT